MNSISNVNQSGLSLSASKELESVMKAQILAGAALDAVPLTKLEHAFVPGAYARQLWRPKGTLIVGKIHKHSCFNFVMFGRLTVWSESGRQEITGPYFFVSPGGQRRVTFAHEDTLLITVHGTDKTDLDELERELVFDESAELLPDNFKQFLTEDGIV